MAPGHFDCVAALGIAQTHESEIEVQRADQHIGKAFGNDGRICDLIESQVSVIENGDASDQVGCVRDFRLKDGSRVREQLLFLSDAMRGFSYCVLEAQAPLRNYVASVRLRPVTSDNTCLMEWRASFEPPPQERARLERFVREDIMEAGFAGLRRALTTAAPAAHRPPISGA